MTVNLTERQKAVNAEIERFQSYEKARAKRMETMGIVYAAVLRKAVGKEQAVEFMNGKLADMPADHGVFLGADGVERGYKPNAVAIDAGWCMTKWGAYYALKATDSAGNTQILPMEPAMLSACVQDMTIALANYQDTEGSLYSQLGMEASQEYEKCLAEMEHDHLGYSGKAQEIYRQARAEAELTIRSHAAAAETKAMEVAERKVEAIVRKLSQAAAMPAGIERSMVLEECQPMIRKAFGG